jgi:transcriptional regulator with XRE-family HTH domain
MKTLAAWLQEQLEARDLTQQTAAIHAGISPSTLSEIISGGHIPKIETLFRLADYLETPRETLVRLAARMPIPDSDPVDEDDSEYLIPELLEAFRKLPDDVKPVVLQQVQLFIRLSNRPPMRFIGDEEEDTDQPDRQQEQAHGPEPTE